MVYAFKQVLSIQDTNLLLKALHQTGENPYNAFKNAESSVIEALNKQILDESERFKDMDSDDLTEKLTLILKLTLDAALKKRLAEQLLDQLSSSDSK